MPFFVAALVLILDQATKYLAVRALSEISTSPFIPGILHWTLVYNRGVAFGFFRQHPGILIIFITASLVILAFWAMRMKAEPLIHRIALGLILGGAFGNWIDRLRIGAVIDFIDFRIWPVFNGADSAITIGVGLFLMVMLKGKKA